MDTNPLTERASWIAGIIGCVIAAVTFYNTFYPQNKLEEKPPSTTQAPNLSPPSTSSIPLNNVQSAKLPLEIGGCVLDSTTVSSLKINGLFDELVHLCSAGKASTIGQSFRLPHLHADERFQYFNPGEFNNTHGLSDGRITKVAVHNEVTKQIYFCFNDGFEKGASPHERIDLELECLKRQGLQAQDKAFF